MRGDIMEVNVRGGAPPGVFLSAAEMLETRYDVDDPVYVTVEDDPDTRTHVLHYSDHHEVVISAAAVSSAMARELILHEFAHVVRHEEGHTSHHLEPAEALMLGTAGRRVPRSKLIHCYQIANHMRDIYADDITLDLLPPQKLMSYLTSAVAAAVTETRHPTMGPHSRLVSRAPDPEITAVNAAFAMGVARRHDVDPRAHRLEALAHAAADDAPRIDVDIFADRFAKLQADPSTREYRRDLVEMMRTYLWPTPARQQAAD
jgi:hypothetical protein